MNIKPASPEDLLRWPSGDTCLRKYMEHYPWLGDDFEVIPKDHPEYDLLIEEAIE
jgi:hypothetical protein